MEVQLAVVREGIVSDVPSVCENEVAHEQEVNEVSETEQGHLSDSDSEESESEANTSIQLE